MAIEIIVIRLLEISTILLFAVLTILSGLYRYSSNLPDIPPGDMMTVVTNKTSWHAVGEQIGSFIITVYKTYSDTGEVKLRSANWRDEPSVDFNLLSDQRDLERMMDGVRRFSAMHLTPTMEGVTADPFPASYSDKVRQVGLLSRKNKMLTDGFAKMLDGPAALRKYLMKKYVMEGVTIHDMLTDDEKLEAFVRKASVGRVACVLHLPDGCGGRPDGGHRQRRPGARGGGVAGHRCLDLPGGAVRQHEFPGADDGGEGGGRDPRGGVAARLRRGVAGGAGLAMAPVPSLAVMGA